MEKDSFQTELFSQNTSQTKSAADKTPPVFRPLADRLRPSRLEEYVGQTEIMGEGTPLRRAIETGQLHSFLLWGPPGSGKTTLARILAQYTDHAFVTLSAVNAGIKDIKEVIERSRIHKREGRGTVLFVDEIHRFNKSQQDALLPYVEDGTVTLIGATTENPSFEVNSALLSRLSVYVLKPLSPDDILILLHKALLDSNQGLAHKVETISKPIPEEWLTKIAETAQGDARRALHLLEKSVVFLTTIKNIEYTDDLFQKAMGHKSIRFDATGEEHYNTISAFIKSMRDSDPDAAVYYLARMLEGGEDPLFIARRMVIFASEDIGNADPRALTLALNVKEAVDFVGMPEARINLSHAVTYLASAPKSNASYMAGEKAMAEVRKSGNLEIPLHIRNAPTKLMKDLGYHKGYKYAHDYEDQITNQINLPDKIKKTRFYEPKDVGLESQIKTKVNQLWENRKKT